MRVPVNIRFCTAIAASFLLSIPAMAAGVKPLGVVLTANRATLDNANATTGADVFPGDALVTNTGGSLRVTMGASQIYLLATTSATLEPDQNRVQARVNIGVMGFSSTVPAQLLVQTPLGSIRGANAQPIFGQVAVASATKLRVTSFKGTLIFRDATGAEKEIAAGETYDASSDPTDQEPEGGVIPAVRHPVNLRKVADYAIPIIAAGVLACTLWPESPSQVGCF